MKNIQPCDGGSCIHRQECLRYVLKPTVKCEELLDPPYYFTNDGWQCPDFIDNPPEVA